MEIYRLVRGEPFDMAHADHWNLVSRTVNSGSITGFRGAITAEGKEAGVTLHVHLPDDEIARLLKGVMRQPDMFPKTAAAANQLDARELRNVLEDRIQMFEQDERTWPRQGFQLAADALKAVHAYLDGDQDRLKKLCFMPRADQPD